jgi:predicted dehydrogenase/nucleoside-diphosphate-sugar epimerase
MTPPAPSPSPPRTATEPAAAPNPRVARRRVGLLGTGYIADWHAKAAATLEQVDLVAVCDKVLPRAQAFAEKFAVTGVYESLDDMLAAGRLDAVHILLPPDLHVQAARTLLEAGVHVLSEKPMCARVEDCESLVRLAEARGLSLGVGHNFLFSPPYEQLRSDVRAGLLGPIDHVAITWHRELPQAREGPFDLWMLRDPGNIMLEIGSHSVAHLLDLVGPPEAVQVQRSNPAALPTGGKFYRRWKIDAARGPTAVQLLFSFVPGFDEHTIHVRGLLGSAIADLDRNTYTLRRHQPRDDDFNRHAMLRDEARSQKSQARQTLRAYLLSKFRRNIPGTPYGASIARTLQAFYAGLEGPLDERLRGRTATEVIRVCETIARSAGATEESVPAAALPSPASAEAAPARILILGSTGFIGRELLRQLVQAGQRTRVLLRSPGKLPQDLRTPQVDPCSGDLNRESDIRRAMEGIDCVYHLARASVKTWADYERYEIGGTRRVAEAALAAGVKRLIYTGTIDSYDAGGADIITEDTPLDRRMERRNLYARAKAASEEILLRMNRERGLPIVIFRPGIVIGRGGSPFHWGVGMWRHGYLCQLWGSGRTPLPLVLVEDVAKALTLALDKQGLDGESFNLVADPCLTAQDYLDELERCGGFRLQRFPTSILKFYSADMFKWLIKILVRHPERRRPSYHDWQSRTQRATFDCSKAKSRLGWHPVSDRNELVRRGIHEPLKDILS